MKPLVIAALASLAGCAGVPSNPPVKTVTVYVPTSVSCVPKDYAAPPVSPVTAEALRTAADAAARHQLLAEFWTAQTPVLALQAGVIAKCQAAAPAAR